jgi:hypothetical protein
MSSSWRLPRRLDLTAWEKMPRMKRKMRMPMTKEMLPTCGDLQEAYD